MNLAIEHCSTCQTWNGSACNCIAPITDHEFKSFRGLIREMAGIHLSDGKKALVTSRLGRRLRHYDLRSFSEYIGILSQPEARAERQVMVDLLTTNETYFFREDRHFSVLAKTVLPSLPHGDVPVWSAACSSGEEPYSLAMLLADAVGLDRFTILGTDISTRMLERARGGIYEISAAGHIPPRLLARYCLKGVRSQSGKLLVEPALQQRVTFRQLNLNGPWEGLPRFQVIFLRNVMIYFDTPTKQRLIGRLAGQLYQGGYLFVGHSETLNGISDRFATIVPSVYRLRS